MGDTEEGESLWKTPFSSDHRSELPNPGEWILVIALVLGALVTLVMALWLLDACQITWTGLQPVNICKALTFSVLAGISEEFLFRRVLQRSIVSRCGAAAACVISAVSFGLLHLGNPGATWMAGAGTAAIGLFLAVVFERTGDLRLCMAAHASWNALMLSVLGAVTSGFAIPGLLTLNTHGEPWLTGGTFGLEASVLCIVIFLAISALVWATSPPANRDRRPETSALRA